MSRKGQSFLTVLTSLFDVLPFSCRNILLYLFNYVTITVQKRKSESMSNTSLGSYKASLTRKYKHHVLVDLFLWLATCHIAKKFGGKLNMVVWQSSLRHRIKICQYLILAYIRMAIPYQTAKLKALIFLQ